jgi:hypothetical protein
MEGKEQGRQAGREVGKRGRRVERDKAMEAGRGRGEGEDHLRCARDCESLLGVEFAFSFLQNRLGDQVAA